MSPPTHQEEPPPDDDQPTTLLAEVRDSIAPRTVGLVVGVLLLQLGFILSYVGAFHAPKPHHISIAIVAPVQDSAMLVREINAIPSGPLRAGPVRDERAARGQVSDGTTSAALIVNVTGSTDTLLVASGGGVSVVTAVEQVTTQIEGTEHRTANVVDLVPLQRGDAHGLAGFYLVVGWIVGGYLVAALLGITRGARPANPRRAVIRLLSVVPYAMASGLCGALVVDQTLGALTGHYLALAAVGTLLVFGAAAVTMGFQVLLGVLGIGMTLLVFVVLGNPSAGGAYQPALLPPFWRAISTALPNGAGTDSVRRIVYFGSGGITEHLIVLTTYVVAGVLVTLGASLLRAKSESRPTPSVGAPARPTIGEIS
jgi:hypothetical protein